MVIRPHSSSNGSTLLARGFSLVEVLVTIAIVAVLGGVGIAAMKTVRSTANVAGCASNLRQIGVGLQLHASEHQGVYPDTSHTAEDGKSWIYQLEDYLGDFDRIRICPSDPKAEIRLKNKASSYILNSKVFVPPLDAFDEPTGPALNRLSALPDPSATILVFIASNRAGLYPGDDHTHSDHWNSWQVMLQDIAPDRHNQRSSANSTKGCANYLYADGHVQTIPANEIKTSIDHGINIAAVPGVHR